jgi:hypothetical protein
MRCAGHGGGIGPVELCARPTRRHPLLRANSRRPMARALAMQGEGDLGSACTARWQRALAQHDRRC